MTGSRATDRGLDEASLLELMYQCPVAIATTALDGTLELLNAVGANYLLPRNGGRAIENLFEFLRPFDPSLEARCREFEPEGGSVLKSYRVTIDDPDSQAPAVVLTFDVSKVSEDRLVLAFNDITQVVLLEDQSRVIEAERAMQVGRVEILTSILHDLGNAVTSVATRVADIAAEDSWEECQSIGDLSGLFREVRPVLERGLGADRCDALLEFTTALKSSLRERERHARGEVEGLQQSIFHIQEILAIQRAQVRDGSGRRVATCRAEDLLQDALTIADKSLVARGVVVELRLPNEMPPILCDRTQIVQALLNMLKNATEAFDQLPDAAAKTLRIEVAATDQQVELTVVDNGPGFDPETGSSFLDRGRTTKIGGSGLGLSSCVAVAEAHGGEFVLTSPGPGLGAVARITLPLHSECSA